jgi:PhnB protein
MTHINAYLNFNGQCREAMTFYQECLGGELVMQKISESPMAARVPFGNGCKDPAQQPDKRKSCIDGF